MRHRSRLLLASFACALLLPSFVLAAETPAAPPSAGTCSSSQQCGKDEFCAKLFGRCEEAGKCEAKPTDCTERGKLIVHPVCGCDGHTYDNLCLAAIAGTSVQHEGKCSG